VAAAAQEVLVKAQALQTAVSVEVAEQCLASRMAQAGEVVLCPALRPQMVLPTQETAARVQYKTTPDAEPAGPALSSLGTCQHDYLLRPH
jgi:hypothetical protein